MSTLAPTALAARTATAETELAAAAPGLLPDFRAALPRATGVVAGRLAAAVEREGLGPAGPGLVDAAERLGSPRLAEELADAVVHLALAYARRDRTDGALRDDAARTGARDAVALAERLPADEQTIFFERLATEGHNLHPCGRTRLGWSVADALAHDLEAGATTVGFVAVRRDLHVGDDVGARLGVPGTDRHVVQPVHAWQLNRVVRDRHARLVASGALVPLDGVRRTGAPTAALRTLLLDPEPDGRRFFVKLSLDIQVTSTRRSISVASTRNGPAVSALLHRLFADDPAAGRILLMSEVAGAAGIAGDPARDLAAILRAGLTGRLEPGEVAVPGSALAAVDPVSGRTVLCGLLDRYAATHGHTDPRAAAVGFLDGYARLVLPPLLRLAARYGIGLEAHLQNCVPTFLGGVPYRLALRDFAGLRVHRPRLAAAGVRLALWPGSVVGTDDVDVMRAKLGYTAIQAHLGEVVRHLADGYGFDRRAGWAVVRAVVDEVYADLPDSPDARDDHAFLTAPVVPHKALVRMRLAGAGDVYVPVPNPLR
jgi:siderophore synthetase component